MSRGATGEAGPRRTLLLAALAAGESWVQAAKTAGVSRATIGRRMADPVFKAELAGLRHAMLDATLGRLHVGSMAAADCLVKLLASKNDAIQVASARSILENVTKMRSELELAARIEALERRLGEQADRPVTVQPLREVR